MNTAGHNNPPGTIEHSNETATALSTWMADHPAILNEEDAREGKALVDRAKAATEEMENERTALVRPLNEQVKEINDRYREPRNAVGRVLEVLVSRLDSFVRAEEQRKLALAQKAAARLALAESEARAAEEAERNAIDSANAGTLDIDVSEATSQADSAFSLYKQARREAKLAERESKVKIGGGFRKALTLKNKETLDVTDWHEAIAFMGLTDKIKEAILSEARAFRQEFEELPPGITATYDRSL